MGNACAGEEKAAKNESADLKGRKQQRKRAGGKKAKGAAVQETNNEEFELFRQEFDDGDYEDYYTDPEDFDTDEDSDDEDMTTDTITLQRKGQTKDLFDPKCMKKIVKHANQHVRSKFKALKPFQYR